MLVQIWLTTVNASCLITPRVIFSATSMPSKYADIRTVEFGLVVFCGGKLGSSQKQSIFHDGMIMLKFKRYTEGLLA
jgi:hypothetical protein